ncbi:MAG: ATP-dependent zinc metalloprotease FtsH [Planctomycetaceae bacterium]|jgi:cell division protease FtsH|nr:ATP-dependent zinc metalloprotease FtsH [Planctomycetaceae bacterium]
MNQPSSPLPPSQQPLSFPKSIPHNTKFFLLLGGLICLIFFLSLHHSSINTRKLNWGEFRQELDAGNIVNVNAIGTSLSGKIKSPNPKDSNKTVIVNFSTEIPLTALSDQEIEKQIYTKLGKNYNASPVPDVLGMLMIISIIASVGIVIVFMFMFRRTRDQILSGAGNGLLGFGRSPARRYNNNANHPTTFEDVAGLDSIKKELLEIVDYLKDPQKYQRMGARVPKGTLLVGPPGTGKTLLGRAVAGEAGVPFFSINGSEFIQMFAGVGASRVRDLFQTAKESAPAILFIDEIDAVGRHRGTGIGAGHDEREQTLNQILSEMDGFTPSESVMVMAATNRPDVLDPALLRPGRFDRHITVDRPTVKGREAIFKVHVRHIPLASDVDINVLARRTVGFTGADIRNLVNEATLWATRNGKNEVEKADFDYAQDKVVMGLRREEVITPEERKKVAYHEAGHTVVGWFQPLSSPVHKVSIVPRGRSLGATYTLPEGDPIGLSAKQAHAQLAFAMGGRAAERLVFDELPAGVENDLKQATKLARRMVSSWGMSGKLGPVAFSTDETHPFLGREMNTNREFSEETARLIDEEIGKFLADADALATQLLREHRTLLDQLAAALEAEEEIDEPRLVEILGISPFKTIDKKEQELA